MDATEALDVLGVRAGTDLAGVRAAYRGLVRAAHPDLAPGEAGAHARTARLTEAYAVLVAFAGVHGTTPEAVAPEPEPEVVPPDGAITVDAPDEGSIALDVPPPEAYALLYEGAGRVGEIAYCDRRLGILEIIVRFEGGPSCSVVMTLAPERPAAAHGGRAHHTEVLCTMESIEARPAPPIGPVIDALVTALRSVRGS